VRTFRQWQQLRVQGRQLEQEGPQLHLQLCLGHAAFVSAPVGRRVRTRRCSLSLCFASLEPFDRLEPRQAKDKVLQSFVRRVVLDRHDKLFDLALRRGLSISSGSIVEVYFADVLHRVLDDFGHVRRQLGMPGLPDGHAPFLVLVEQVWQAE
jgi:hypothetical protein